MADKATEPSELFLQMLGEILTVERALADEILPQMSEQAQDQELADGFSHHAEETREHVRNVEEVFSKLGEKATEQPSKTLEALERDYRQTIQEIGPAELGDCFRTAAAAKTEHLEIAAYTGLVKKAQAMGQTEAVQLLQQNLQQEQNMLQELETISDQLTQQMASMAGASAR